MEGPDGKPIEKMLTRQQDIDFDRLDALAELNELLGECNAELRKLKAKPTP